MLCAIKLVWSDPIPCAMNQRGAFAGRAGIHKYIIMNYTQGGRQMHFPTLWIEQFGRLYVVTYGRRCPNRGRRRPNGTYHFPSARALCDLSPCGRLRLGSVLGEMYFLFVDVEAGASGLIGSIFLPLRGASTEEKRRKTHVERE